MSNNSKKTPITVAHGDGIGPEIMAATLKILEAANAQLDIEQINIGKSVYEQGVSSGIEDSAWESLRRTKLFLKAPITTPQGGGYKSLNVTVRKTLGLYANVRPCIAYSPFVKTKNPGMDLVIVRENEEDLYAGIEHRQTYDVTQCLKLISHSGSEKIIRYAFEYAKQNHRRKVTCFSKDNIMKITDGLFHRVFNEIGAEYPDIEKEHWIIDIGAAKVADKPEQFDVIVMPNLYGDIVSDIAAEVSGSVGLGCSANIGEQCSMFEAIHGSAPDIAGKNIANPSGLLLAAVMMLVHIGQSTCASLIHNAWLTTIEDGVHTGDIANASTTTEKVGTDGFTDAVIARLGKKPRRLPTVNYKSSSALANLTIKPHTDTHETRELVGVDVFLFSKEDINSIAKNMQQAAGEFELTVISSRGLKLWPDSEAGPSQSDHLRCRFVAKQPTNNQEIVTLLSRINDSGADFIKIENLYNFDGKPGYSKSQGE